MTVSDERSRLVRFAPLIIFILSFFVFAVVAMRMRCLWDSDSYYHLAVARLYAQEGITAKPPWGRFSMVSAGGDKEFLFHLGLMPLVTVMNPPSGGRLALAALNAAIFTVVASFSLGILGWPGLLVPVWMYLAVPPFLSRVIRLRPELVALLIILVAVTLWPRRRALFLGVLALVFTLAYTALHLFLALSFLWFAIEWFRSKLRPDLSLVWAPVIGTVVGFVARPHVPGYARIWYAQNVLFFLHKDQLDVGEEILPPSWRFLLRCLPWALVLAALLVVGCKRGINDQRILALSASAIFFLILFSFMGRVITYVVPLVTLAVVGQLQRAMSFRRTLTVAAILILGSLVGLVMLTTQEDYVPHWLFSRDANPELFWSRVAGRLPAGGRVATSWGNADLFAYWAPQARYLNLLDPIFMFTIHPERQIIWRKIVSGSEPDVARAVASTLDSDFLLINPLQVSRTLSKRLAGDPRFVPLEQGLYKLQPAAGVFVMDWRTREGRSYPRDQDERGRTLEGFITLQRLGERPCELLTHEEPPNSEASSFEFAPHGKSLLRVDGRNLVSSRGTPGAILGQGYAFTIPASTVPRLVEVETCRAADGTGGFYLVRRR